VKCLSLIGSDPGTTTHCDGVQRERERGGDRARERDGVIERDGRSKGRRTRERERDRERGRKRGISSEREIARDTEGVGRHLLPFRHSLNRNDTALRRWTDTAGRRERERAGDRGSEREGEIAT